MLAKAGELDITSADRRCLRWHEFIHSSAPQAESRRKNLVRNQKAAGRNKRGAGNGYRKSGIKRAEAASVKSGREEGATLPPSLTGATAAHPEPLCPSNLSSCLTVTSDWVMSTAASQHMRHSLHKITFRRSPKSASTSTIRSSATSGNNGRLLQSRTLSLLGFRHCQRG